jgi:FMN-dependent NADH-azoreductase
LKILHIDTGVQGSNSLSRDMSRQVVEKIRAAHPDAELQYLDLANDPVPHLGEAALPLIYGQVDGPIEDVTIEPGLSRKILKDFLDSDCIIVGAALYNLTVSSALKAWIDRVVILNQTFRYSEDGTPIGLATEKRAILCVSRGGYYAAGSPAAAMEFCENYLRAIFGFMGFGQVDAITADGTSVGPEQRQQAVDGVSKQLEDLEV